MPAGAAFRDVRLVVLAGFAAALVSLAGICVHLPADFSELLLFEDFLVRCAILLLSCAATALIEELVFRGALLGALLWRLGQVMTVPALPVSRLAVFLAAAVFALFHVVPEFCSIGPSALSAMIFAAAVMKFAQAFLFGFCMGAVAVRTRSLLVPVVVHFAFDVLYFAPHVLVFGVFPEGYLGGGVGDLAVLFVTVLLFSPVVAKCNRWL